MEEEDDVFEIERILETSVKKGIRYYRVRWKGFNENDDTWEPEENLFGCKDVLDQYWKKNKKNNQSKVKKRKSESTNQTLTTKAKKKKSGRTTNNSTIALIDSSSSQDEKIVFPDTNKKASAVKHSKTKRERGTVGEVRLNKNRPDSSQENNSSNKTTKKRKKQKEVVDKDSSLKTELEQPCEVKQTLDENENTKDIEQTVPEEITSLITFVDDNSTTSKSKFALQRENSRESLGDRSVGKRRSWSSYEASPEFVPEYCDETLAYDIASEEEFEYFGDTEFFVKDSVGYDDSNCFEPTEKLPADEHFQENNNLLEDDKCEVKDNDSQVKDSEGYTEDDEVHVKDDEDHIKNDGGHAEDDNVHVKDDEKHVKDGEEHVKGDEEHEKGDQDHIKDDEDHVKFDEDHVKDDEDHVKDDEDHLKDAEDHVKDGKEKLKVILPAKEVRTEGGKQEVNSLPEHDSNSRDDSILDHNIQKPEEDVFLKNSDDSLDEGLKCEDNNTDLVNSDGVTGPKLNSEESDSKTLGSDDTKLNESLSDVGEEPAAVGHVRSLKTNELKLKIRLGNSGDSAGLTDSECMSPEFVKLPEPRKDDFDKVFSERMSEDNATHTLTNEKENKEIKSIDDDCGDEPNKTGTRGHNSCDYTKNEANSKVELHKSTATVKTSNVALAEQSVVNTSENENLHHDTKSIKRPKIPEQKTPNCDKTKSLEMDDKCDEKWTQSKTSKFEKVSSMDDFEEQTCPSADLNLVDKQRKLSEEETAHCLLDLSSVRISEKEVNERIFPSSNEQQSSVVDMDLDESEKLESGKEITHAKRPHARLGKSKNAKRKSAKKKDKGKKVKVLLNLPFIDQGSEEVLGILDNAMKPNQEGEIDSKRQCLPSSDKTVDLTTVQDETPTSMSTKELSTTTKQISTSLLSCQEMACDKKLNDSSQNTVKSLKISTDKSKTSSVQPSEIKQTVTDVNTASTSYVKQKLSTTSEPDLPHPQVVQQDVSRPALPKDQLPSVNTLEKEPEIEDISEDEQNADSHTDSCSEKNQSDSVPSKQDSTKVTKTVTSVNDKKDLLEGSSTSVLMKENLDSHGGIIRQVYGRGRYEGADQETGSWKSNSINVHLAQFNPTSLSYINPHLYADSPSANTFIVSHVNQEGFSAQPGSFAGHFTQQPFATRPNINVHQKPFAAVAGINWYPENRPRQMSFTTCGPIAPKPFYYMPALPVSSPYPRQVTPNNLYARALQEMAKKRQPESSGQAGSSGLNDFSSPIDADKAWYAKHVGNINTTTSSHNVKMIEENIKTPSIKNQAEMKTKITNDTSNTIKEKADTNSPTAKLRKDDSCVAEMKESFTGEGLKNNSNTTSSLSKSKAAGVSTNLGSAACQIEVISSTTTAIGQSEDKAVDKEKQTDENKDFDKGKSKDKSVTKSNQKSISHSKPNSKESSLKDAINTNQRKIANEKSDSRSSGNWSNTSWRERCKDSSTDLKKEKKGDFEKSCEKDQESSQKRQNSTDSRCEKDDRRSRRDSKGRQLKGEDSVDSEVEFDLDEYSPGEVIIEKVEKMTVLHTGIPSAMSLREVKTAIKRGDSATVLASLAGGMNIDSQDTVSGMTLLMRAVSFGQENIVRLLLNHGANVNIKDNTGSTPLIAACEQGFENIVSLLLNAEININAKQTLSGETALIKACMNGFYSVVAMLLAQGADCQMRSVSGLTAAQLAAQSGHFEIRDLLESHGKKLQRCVETAIASCLCDSSRLMYPPLLPFVSLYPAEGQQFTYHFHCSKLLLSKTVLLFCLRAVFARSGQVDLSFLKDNGVHTVLLNGSLQSPVLSNNKSVFVLQPKLDTNRLILQTYQSHVHLLVCIYAAELDEGISNIEPGTMAM